jgi:hypothetical protein
VSNRFIAGDEAVRAAAGTGQKSCCIGRSFGTNKSEAASSSIAERVPIFEGECAGIVT